MRDCPRRREVGKVPAEGIQPVAPEDRTMNDELRMTNSERCAVEELKAKCADFLAGRFGNLTTDEIAEFREAQADPDGSKWEREHAGEAFGMDAIDLDGFLFVEFPAEMPLEKCAEILRKFFRTRTITPARLWWVTNSGALVEAIAREEARHD